MEKISTIKLEWKKREGGGRTEKKLSEKIGYSKISPLVGFSVHRKNSLSVSDFPFLFSKQVLRIKKRLIKILISLFLQIVKFIYAFKSCFAITIL